MINMDDRKYKETKDNEKVKREAEIKKINKGKKRNRKERKRKGKEKISM